MLIIIDGNAIIHRAYHALPPMTTKDGTMVNAVFGFASMLLKVINDIKPTHLAVSFDLSGPTFRDDLYTEYKATRVKADQDLYDQIPLVYELVQAFDIPIFTKEGYEADDVIGTIAEQIKDKIQVIIVTGDKDLLQLVDERKVEVYLLKKGLSEFELYDDAKIREQFGFGPEAFADYKALLGDTSDNIPGVSGIGKKTAEQLIQQFGSIAGIYAAGEKNIKAGMYKKLVDGQKDAELSLKLSTIMREVPDVAFDLKKSEVHTFDPEVVKKLFAKFEFFSMIARIPGVQGIIEQKAKKRESKKVKFKLQVIKSEEMLAEVLAELSEEKEISCKEVMSSNDIFTSEILGFILAMKKKTYFIEKAPKEVFVFLADKKRQIIGHDVKSLVKVLQHRGVHVRGTLFDVMIASYVVYGSTRRHDLPSLLERDLEIESAFSAQQDSLFGVDVEPLAKDLQHLFALHELYTKELKKMQSMNVFETIEMPLVPILADMELAGISVDLAVLKEMSKDAAKTIRSLEKKIWKEAGEKFNVASSTQLRDILFEKLEMPTHGIKKGKTGYSTAASELEKLVDQHPIIPLIEEYREVEKLRNTYIDVLPSLVHPKTGRIHTSFNQTVAATGRLSSSDPNLQNIPIRTELGREVRKAFVVADGCTLVIADYSQIELRIAAHLSQDQTLIDIFKRGDDVHAATAAAINDVPLEKVTKKMRSAAKAVNFGVLFGMGAYGLSWRTGMTQRDAKIFIDKYYEAFSGLRTYLDRVIDEAKETGYAETLFGRRRYVPELSSSNFQLRAAGERMAINMPIQGTEADMMKLAMIKVQEQLQKKKEEARMLLQVHDELVLEVKKGAEKEVAKIVQTAMQDVVKLDVPVVVDIHVARSWGEVK